MMTTLWRRSIPILSLFLVPFPAYAQMVISEIMYDLDGSDSGREWVEVFNTGGTAIDLSAWKLYESETAHTITLVAGGASVAGGGYAVIADNAGTFLADHPSFAGPLFDSAFSLNNVGETLGLRDATLADRDTISYSVDMGAADDGNSLHRTSASGSSLQAGTPNPGAGTLAVSLSAETQSPNTGGTQSSAVQTGGSYPVEPQIAAYAGNDRTVITGADVAIEGKAFTKDGEPLGPTGVRFLWNFGDGMTAEGPTVMHRWVHPGRYVVTLDVSASKNTASHRVIVTAKAAEFGLTTLSDGSAVVENRGSGELNVSFWHIRYGNDMFTLPEDTIVLAQEKIIIPPASLGFTVADGWVLLYPNGVVAQTAPPPKPLIIHAPADTAPAVKTQPPRSSGKPVQQTDGIEETGEVEPAERSPAQDAAVASAAMAVGKDEKPTGESLFDGWMIGLIALTSLGATGAYFASRAGRKEWEIIEE